MAMVCHPSGPCSLSQPPVRSQRPQCGAGQPHVRWSSGIVKTQPDLWDGAARSDTVPQVCRCRGCRGQEHRDGMGIAWLGRRGSPVLAALLRRSEGPQDCPFKQGRRPEPAGRSGGGGPIGDSQVARLQSNPMHGIVSRRAAARDVWHECSALHVSYCREGVRQRPDAGPLRGMRRQAARELGHASVVASHGPRRSAGPRPRLHGKLGHASVVASGATSCAVRAGDLAVALKCLMSRLGCDARRAVASGLCEGPVILDN